MVTNLVPDTDDTHAALNRAQRSHNVYAHHNQPTLMMIPKLLTSTALKICQKWSVWTIDLFTVAWECIWSEEDEADCDKEMEKEKVRMRLYRKIFNARCNTTFNWHKRNAMINDRVNFRGTLRVKSMGKTESQANSMSEVFDNVRTVDDHGLRLCPRVFSYDEL